MEPSTLHLRHVGLHDLDGHVAVEDRIVGSIDPTHAALSHESLHFVALEVSEETALGEAPLGQVSGGRHDLAFEVDGRGPRGLN
jgi:hypothetical protein